MTKPTAKYASLDAQLKAEGFMIQGLYRPTDVEGLTQFLFDVARGKYKDYRIVPGDIARRGENWILSEPAHIVYVKEKRRPRKKGGGIAIRLVGAQCKNRESNEYRNIFI